MDFTDGRRNGDITVGVKYSPKIVTDGLVLALDAANQRSYPGSGTVWNDLSGNGNDGTLTNGPTFDSGNKGSISFDGSNDYVSLPSPTDKWTWTPSGNGNNIITFEMWVNSNDTNGNYFSKPWNGNGEYNYRVLHNSFLIQVGAQSKSLPFTSLATDSWEYLVCIITNEQFAIYRNGILDAGFTNHDITNNTPTHGNSNLPLALMTLYPYGTGVWGSTGFSILGNMSIFKPYNRALTASEVLQNYNATKGRFGL